jgi:hypothetical protein
MTKPNSYALPALLELHATLAGEMQRSNEHYFKLAEQMRSIEAVIRLMDPTFKISKIAVKRRKLNPWFKHGDLYRTCLGIIRRADNPLTAREVAERAFAEGRIEHTPEDVQRLRKIVRIIPER